MVQFMCKNDAKEMRFYKVETNKYSQQNMLNIPEKMISALQARVTAKQTYLMNPDDAEHEDFSIAGTAVLPVAKAEEFIYGQVKQMQDKLALRNTKRPDIVREKAELLLEKEFLVKKADPIDKKN